ncbi:MAG: hypothetical protein NTY01_11090 [Verrucomicrobia bacterium]|nr:hypothetical protein [Verrucomicrobiota bacterium]
MKHLLFAGALATLAVAADAETPRWAIVVSPAGAVRVERDGKEFGTMTPALFEVPWQFATMSGGKGGEMAKDGVHRGQIRAASGGMVDVELRKTAETAGAHLEYRLTPRSEMKLNSLNVTLTLPTPLWAGGKFIADGKESALPVMFKNAQVYARPTKSLKISPPGGAALRLDFTEPAHVLVQDDRQWGETFSVRIESPNTAGTWPAGRTATMAFTLGAEGGLKVEEDKPITITAGAEWLPLDVDLDIEAGSALDFSRAMPRHVPAGRFGRVIATRQGKFAFEKRATPARFYGVNFCFTAQYLPHELADRLAERLARLGYNAVRIHHYESELVERGLGGPRLKADRLDQFDYLFAALKQRGIYVTTDLFVSRPVALADIYEGEPGNIGMDEFKMAIHVNDRAFENYKAFARALLDHENPYTKLRYADDPALAWLSLVNENCPGNFISGLKGKLRDDWQRAWNRWLAARYPDRESLARALGNLKGDQDAAKGTVPLASVYGRLPAVVAFNAFLAEIERDFFERTRKFLRDELRCKALMTDCNAWSNPVQLQAVRAGFDYVDDHFYVDHPQFLERDWSLPSRCANTSPIAGGATGGRGCAFTRVFGKPFTITEFNYSGPGRFRGVGGTLTGALGAVQDWDGLWRFAYSHQRENVARPGAMNYFDLAADPLNLAAERASLCLFLRGDLQPAKHAVALASEPGALLKQTHTSHDKTPSWHGMAWLTRVGWLLGGDTKPAKNDLVLSFSGSETNLFASGTETTILDAFRERHWLPESNRTDFKKNTFQSENGEVTIDAAENILTLDTARTAGGFAPAGKQIKTRAATIEIVETDATVWVSSLDGKPIAASKRLLITHLTDLQNSGARYGERNRQILQSWGQLPHLVRAGRANVTLRLKNAERAKIHALAVNGKRVGKVSASVKKDGAISIPLSVAADGKARMLYEVDITR